MLFISKSFYTFLINCMLKPKEFIYKDINIYGVPGNFWIQTKLFENGSHLPRLEIDIHSLRHNKILLVKI